MTSLVTRTLADYRYTLPQRTGYKVLIVLAVRSSLLQPMHMMGHGMIQRTILPSSGAPAFLHSRSFLMVGTVMPY